MSSNIKKIKTIELIGGIDFMVKYKINLKFKDNVKSLNEIITEVLKIEIKNKFNMTCDNLKIEQLSRSIPYYKKDGRIK